MASIRKPVISYLQFLDLVVDRVETWTRSNSESEQTIYLERCSPFQRKLIYQTLKSKFGQELYMETVDKDKDKVIAVSKVKQLSTFQPLKKSPLL